MSVADAGDRHGTVNVDRRFWLRTLIVRSGGVQRATSAVPFHSYSRRSGDRSDITLIAVAALTVRRPLPAEKYFPVNETRSPQPAYIKQVSQYVFKGYRKHFDFYEDAAFIAPELAIRDRNK